MMCSLSPASLSRLAPNFDRAADGSAPEERMKMMGVEGFESWYSSDKAV
jgi:hypothetical protein